MWQRVTRAMTLVEVLIAVIIGSLVMGAAYGVWTHIRRDMSRSTTRQVLQKQIRQTLDVLATDLKSVKAGTLVPPAGGNPNNWTLEFDRFEDKKADDKFASQQFYHVKYRFQKPLLFRDGQMSGLTVSKLLADNIVAVEMARGGQAAAGGGAPVTDELARDTHLDIIMTGTKEVPGMVTEEIHIERTSVVMRDEYYKAVNKNYTDNQQLAAMNKADVLKVNDNAVEFKDGAFTEDQLRALNKDQLDALKSQQNESLRQTLDSLTKVNNDLGKVDDGWSIWRLGFNDPACGQVDDLRDRLKGAEKAADIRAILGEKDSTNENTVNGFVNKKDAEFFKNTFNNKSESSLSREPTGPNRDQASEREIYRKAYELKMMDRQIRGAYDKMSDSDKQKYYKDGPPKTMREQMMGDAWKQEIRSSVTDQRQAEAMIAQKDAENQRVAAVYDTAKLDWMGTYGNENQEVKAYNAAKQLQSIGESKMALSINRENSENNVSMINRVLQSGNYLKN